MHRMPNAQKKRTGAKTGATTASAVPPSSQKIELSAEQLKSVVAALVRSGGFWWRVVIGIIVLLLLGYWGLVTSIGNRINKAVEQIETNGMQTLQVQIDGATKRMENAVTAKVDGATAAMELAASSRLADVDTALTRINQEANTRLLAIQSALDELQTNVSKRLVASYREITNRIAFEFQDERIKQTVSDVAASHAKGMLTNEVAPILSRFTNELNAFKTSAQTNLDAVQALASFSLLVTRTMNDDRKAFDELLVLAESPPYREIAKSVLIDVTQNLMYEAERRDLVIPLWEGSSKTTETVGIDDYRMKYRETQAPLTRMYLIHEAYSNSRIPLFERLRFLFDIAESESSLKCLNQICYGLNRNLKESWNLLGMYHHLNYWQENKGKLEEEYNKELKAAADKKGGIVKESTAKK